MAEILLSQYLKKENGQKTCFFRKTNIEKTTNTLSFIWLQMVFQIVFKGGLHKKGAGSLRANV